MEELRSLKRRAGVAEQSLAIERQAVQIKKVRLDEAEQEYEEEHRSFTVFSKRLEEKWEQRFDALARLAHDAGVRREDIEAVRLQQWQALVQEQQTTAAEREAVEREAAAEREAAVEQEAATEREAAAEQEAAAERVARAASEQIQRLSQQLQQRTVQLKAAEEEMSKATVRTDLLNRRVRELEASAIVCDRESRQLKEAAVQKKNPRLLHTGCERREGASPAVAGRPSAAMSSQDRKTDGSCDGRANSAAHETATHSL